MSLRRLLAEFTAYEAELQRMLDACRNKKKPEAAKCDRSNIPDGFWMDSKCQLHKVTPTRGTVWLLGSPEMEQQAQVFGSERGINSNYDKSQGKGPTLRKGGDPQANRLYYLYQRALWKCNKEHHKANEAYYRCVAAKDGSPSKCKQLFVQRQCPEAVQALAAFDSYRKSRGDGNSGGGGGGGF